MVSICIATFNTQNSACCHTIYLSVQYVFLQQTATISLCSVYQLVFPMEALCSLCGTNWTIKQQILVYQGRVMAQSVSRRPVTVETRLRSQASPFEICGSQSGNRTGFSTRISFFRCYFQPCSDPYLYPSTCCSY